MKQSERIDRNSKSASSDTNDRRLLTAVALGDRQAIAELYESFYPRLFKFLHRLSRDYDVVEETINDVMLIVWRSAGEFRGTSKVSTWILGIAYRQCMKKLRKRRIPRFAPPAKQEFIDERNTSVELDDLIAKALLHLTPEHRMMIEAVLYLGMTYQEVAEIADCPVNTAKTRVHHARKNLRSVLSKQGYRHGEYFE